jgi:hypothetical protein
MRQQRQEQVFLLRWTLVFPLVGFDNFKVTVCGDVQTLTAKSIAAPLTGPCIALP